MLVNLPTEPAHTGGLLWVHGSGMIRGTANQYDAPSRYVAYRLGGVVVAVDYRLAPEDSYPVGLDDGYLALSWLHEAANEFRLSRMRTAIAGESGCGLVGS